MKMYEVITKCGHVGRNFYVIKSFPIRANDGREAAKIAREIPRVKHHHKDAILRVSEINEAEYMRLVSKNGMDPYFNCKCVQDQRMYTETIYTEEETMWQKKKDYGKAVYCGKKLLRNPKKYLKNYYTEVYAV